MAYVIDHKTLEYKKRQSPIPEFSWKTSPKLSEMMQSKHLHFDIRQLGPDKYSYPYHSHRNAEELFVILSGKAMLRTPDGFEEVKQGDMIFFEIGDGGAHQLHNHTEEVCTYIDIRTKTAIDVCDYPDSDKVNIVQYGEIFERKTRVDYYKGEDGVAGRWPVYKLPD